VPAGVIEVTSAFSKALNCTPQLCLALSSGTALWFNMPTASEARCSLMRAKKVLMMSSRVGSGTVSAEVDFETTGVLETKIFSSGDFFPAVQAVKRRVRDNINSFFMIA